MWRLISTYSRPLLLSLMLAIGLAGCPALTSGPTTSLSLGSVSAGLSSPVRSFTISNNGDATSSAVTIESSSSEFVVQRGLAGDCVSGATLLAAGASCTVRVVFAPDVALGYRTGTITFLAVSGGGGSVAVDGTAVAGSLAVLAGAPSGQGSADGIGPAARFYQPGGVAVDGAGNVYVADTGNHTIRKVTPAGAVTTLAGTPGLAGSADGTGTAALFTNPDGVAADAAGNLFVADSGNHTIRRITGAGVVTTFAGTPDVSGSADGTGTTAQFSYLHGIAMDGAGNLFVADSGNNTIRKVTPAGVVTTFAGMAGAPGSADGTGAAARFRSPHGIAVDGAGNLYVTDASNFTVRKVTPAGDVTTVAGMAGESGSADGTGAGARFRGPEGIAVDGSGNLYVADSDNDTVRKITATAVVTTLAGTTLLGGSADGAGAAARFYGPSGIAVGGAGKLYVADRFNATLREITAGGVVTTLAGKAGAVGSEDGAGTAAGFKNPAGVAVDSAGNLYIADYGNYTLRKILPSSMVTTLAGLAGTGGSRDGTGSAARFRMPSGVAVDAAGNLYVADNDNNLIRKVTPAGVVSTFAGTVGLAGSADGTGPAARFSSPRGIAIDAAGNLYIADCDNHTIRKITPAAVVTTLAGTAGSAGSTDGTGAAARFHSPRAVAVDVAGNVYVADRFNHTIRKITPAAVVTTVAGTAGAAGTADGIGAAARFHSPVGVALDGAGNVYVADSENNAIRKVTPAGVVSTVVGIAGSPAGNLPGPLPASLLGPSGVAVDPSTGNLLVTTRSAVLVAGVFPESDGQPCSVAADCASGSCTVAYRDLDGDGFHGISASFCGLVPPTGWTATTSSTDCCDSDADAYPGQSDYFTSAHACGGFDYNCDGVESTMWNGTLPAGGCTAAANQECMPNGCLNGCSSWGGWVGTPLVPCGGTGAYQECAPSHPPMADFSCGGMTCEDTGSAYTCIVDTSAGNRSQRCR